MLEIQKAYKSPVPVSREMVGYLLPVEESKVVADCHDDVRCWYFTVLAALGSVYTRWMLNELSAVAEGPRSKSPQHPAIESGLPQLPL